MKCKNCQTNLKETAKFCDTCGGKVINHRLNFKTITSEFFETFISWDNKFFKTVSHLITKPQEVANGYLDGVRKRYMQPFAYMLIAISVYGIYLVLSKEMMMDYIENMNKMMEEIFSYNSSSKAKEFNNNMLNKLLKYYNVYTLSSIPLLAFINKIIFKQRNFIEHNVALLYSYATFLLLSATIGFVGVILKIDYGTIYTLVMMIMIGYHMWFYKKMFNLDNVTIILKTLFFWLLMLAFYIILFIIGVIIIVTLLRLNLIQR